MTTMKMSTKMALAMFLGICGATMTSSVSAADWSFSFGFGRPVVEHCAPPVVFRPVPQPVRTVRTWVPERYETRTEQVLVCEEHYERQYVPAEYAMRHDHHGRPVKVLVHSGYWTQVLVPARYEARTTQVRVPGYWTEVAVNDRHDHYGHRDHDDRHYDSDRRYDPHGNGHAYGHDKKSLALKISSRR